MRALILLMGLLALSGCDRQSGGGSQADRPGSSESAAPAAPRAGLDRRGTGKPAPDVVFRDGEGAETSLADFAGKPVLLNLWATWCAPCVKELPTLARLAESQDRVAVLALSQDMQPHPTVAAFLDERRIGLEPYQDKDMAMSAELGATVLPTSVLYGSDGREVWRYTGDLDWTGKQAAQLLKEAR